MRAVDIVALGWLAAGEDRVAFLTTRPPGCEKPRDMDDLVRGSDDALYSTRTLGRIAFESPVLLGGAATRTGLSCGSCHINGRGNPHFFIRGISDKPGTADVTNSILSKTRGDGQFNPTVIPDIALRDGKQLKDRTGQAFRDKVHALIEGEFDGAAPGGQVFASVIAYMDGLDPSACGAAPPPPFTSAPSAGEDVEVAEIAAGAGLHLAGLTKDERVFWLRVARARLERVYERAVGDDPEVDLMRRRLLEMSAKLGQAAEAARAGKPLEAFEARVAWLELSSQAREIGPRTLYNAERLKAALASP
jgi:hypothetical protein